MRMVIGQEAFTSKLIRYPKQVFTSLTHWIIFGEYFCLLVTTRENCNMRYIRLTKKANTYLVLKGTSINLTISINKDNDVFDQLYDGLVVIFFRSDQISGIHYTREGWY